MRESGEKGIDRTNEIFLIKCTNRYRIKLSKTAGKYAIKHLLAVFAITSLLVYVSLNPTLLEAQEGVSSPASLIYPVENSVTIDKKPVIECTINIPGITSIYIILDDVDVTDLIEFKEGGFVIHLLSVLPGGEHTLTLYLYNGAGEQIEQSFSFTTRHYKNLEEGYSKNELTAVYEGALTRSNQANKFPRSKVEANLSSYSTLANKGWRASFDTNLRYFDQDLPVIFPDEKGPSLANYRLSLQYDNQTTNFLAETGDILVEETPYTATGLARRGGNLSIRFKSVTARVFDVKSEQLFGFKGGSGIGTSLDDQIIGGSLEAKLLSNSLTFKAVYVTGGEKGSSFGIFTSGGNRKGDVFGFLVNKEIIPATLTGEGEIDFSDFDEDTSDGFPSESDEAYRIRFYGTSGIFSYDGYFEHLGSKYQVIGNLNIQKDREGVTLLGGANYSVHTFNITLSRYSDNVDKDPLIPQLTYYEGNIDYSFNKLPTLPMGASYRKTILDSSKEPAFTLPLKTVTDSLSGRINYIQGPWNLGLQASHSMEDDRTSGGNDSTITTYTFSPTYTSQNFSLLTNLSLNTTKFDISDVTTDTYTANVDLKGNFLDGKLLYDLAGTYNRITSSDNLVDQDSVDSNMRIDFLIGNNLWGFINPSIGLRGQYIETKNRVFDQNTHKTVIYLVLTNSSPFSF